TRTGAPCWGARLWEGAAPDVAIARIAAIPMMATNHPASGTSLPRNKPDSCPNTIRPPPRIPNQINLIGEGICCQGGTVGCARHARGAPTFVVALLSGVG